MLPPLPPPMPPWPGKAPWQQKAGDEARQPAGGAALETSLADQQRMLAYLLGHYHAVQTQQMKHLYQAAEAYHRAQAQAPKPAQAQAQAPQPAPARAQQQQPQSGGAPPQMKVERSEPEKETAPQGFVPVPPVVAVSGIAMPAGARDRSYWRNH